MNENNSSDALLLTLSEPKYVGARVSSTSLMSTMPSLPWWLPPWPSNPADDAGAPRDFFEKYSATTLASDLKISGKLNSQASYRDGGIAIQDVHTSGGFYAKLCR